MQTTSLHGKPQQFTAAKLTTELLTSSESASLIGLSPLCSRTYPWFGMRITQLTLGGRGGRDTNPMKILRLVFVASLLIGMLGDSNASFAVNGIILKEEVSSDSYCHLKFPVIREYVGQNSSGSESAEFD